MESSENPANTNPSAPRDKNSETNSQTTRGRKRDKNNLTTPEGGSDVRDRSKDLVVHFKKPRLTPEGGSDVRDRSKDFLITFKKPRLPKRGLRSKKVASRGNAPPAANVTTPTSAFTPPTLSLTPPTLSLAPPTPSLVPPTPSLTPPTSALAPPTPSLAPPTPSLPPPTPSLAPPTSSLAPPTSLLAPPSVTIRSQVEVNEEDDRRVNKEPCYSLWSQSFHEELRRFLQDLDRERVHLRLVLLGPVRKRVDMMFWRFLQDLDRKREARDKAVKQRIEQLLRRKREARDKAVKQRIEQLLRREDERSREQDSEEHLQKKKQDLISLFRDIEKTGLIWGWRILFGDSQKSSSLREKLDEAVKNFLYQRDKSRLREETQRLYRYQKLLEQWIEAFTREEHDVSFWVGDCLKDVLTQVYDGISRLTWVKSLQSSKSGGQVRFLRRLLHENLGKSGRYFLYQRDEERLGEKTRRLRRYRTLEEPVEMSSPCDPPTALSTTGRFYQSSGGKTSRSLSALNTRKYLRRLHTRTAGGALRRGRSRLTDAGLRLCSQVTHDSGLSVKPDDHKNLSTSRV